MNSVFTVKKRNELFDLPTDEAAPIKRNLENYAYVEAGKTGGDPAAFSACLERILEGHIVNESHDEVKQQAEQDKVMKEIDDFELKTRTLETKIKDLEEVQIPDYKRRIQESKKDIEDLVVIRAEDLVKDSQANFNFWAYLSIFIPLTVFLYAFYVSTFHNAFFRDIAQQITTADASNISSVLNTVFNGSAFIEFHLHWFAPIIFFAFGMVLHRFIDGDSKWRFVWLIAIVLFIFFADGLLAYFIESNNHKLEILMGMNEDEWIFYKSPVFIMVLVMGFFTCMGWSILLHSLREEKGKMNPKAVARKKIAFLKIKIKEIEELIVTVKSEILKSKAEVDNLKCKIESLKRELEVIHYGVNELRLNINTFYSGWLKYIVNLNDFDTMKNECKNIKEKLISELISKIAA